jgi:hypothetical protein
MHPSVNLELDELNLKIDKPELDSLIDLLKYNLFYKAPHQTELTQI